MVTHCPDLRTRRRADPAPRVFRAISDPTRRLILERLNATPAGLTVDAIAAGFPVSRPAISRHLGVLRRAALVHAHKRGRERVYRIDPRPLDAVDQWVAAFRLQLAASLARLKRRAEAIHSSSDTRTNP